MEFELFRLQTFRNWPPDAPVSKERLAKGGFYYTQQALKVQCFKCNLTIDDWEFGDQVISKHKLKNPNCEFVRGDINNGNISLEVVNETELNDFHIRLITFKNWPKEDVIKSVDLVEAGFYFLNVDDKTKCVCCQQTVANWGSGDIPKVVHTILNPSCLLVQDFMKSEYYRELSFQNWAKPEVDVKNLAKAGFFYTGIGDSTKCFMCKAIAKDWVAEDDPDREHKRLFPACKFVKDYIEARLGTNSILKDPACPDYVNLSQRLASFQNSNFSSCQSIKDLAEAGFYYSGSGDLTRCFHCNAALQNWYEDDIPLVEHAKWFPNCHFLMANKSEEFIANCQKLKGTHTSLSKVWADPVTQKALSMDISSNLLRRALISHLKEFGCSFSTTEALVEYALCLSQENNVGIPENKQNVPQTNKNLNGEAKNTFDNLYEENRALKDAKMCKICMDKELQIVFLPCGHFATCDYCSNLVEECPICRIKIENRIKTFLS